MCKISSNEILVRQQETHLFKLDKILGVDSGFLSFPITTMERLSLIEGTLSKVYTEYCNGNVSDEVVEKKEAWAMRHLSSIFKNLDDFRFNRDPRGYALKIKNPNQQVGIHCDLGGFGIIAPNFESWDYVGVVGSAGWEYIKDGSEYLPIDMDKHTSEFYDTINIPSHTNESLHHLKPYSNVLKITKAQTESEVEYVFVFPLIPNQELFDIAKDINGVNPDMINASVIRINKSTKAIRYIQKLK
ncbi:MAG: hypothetical protein ACRDD8_06350 [Bacteroidales bacterium]